MASLSHIPAAQARLRSYFASGITRSADWRRRQLRGLVDLIDQNSEAILKALKADLGKPTQEAAFAEVISVKTEILASVHDLDDWMKPTSVASPISLLPGKSFIQPEPYGTVLIIGPFNYPFQLTILPLAAAISAGNVAVIKPSELTPATSGLVGELLPRYLDKDSFAYIQGEIAETTELLRLKWDYIFFTGSEMVGKIVLKAAAEHLTPVTLELGGKSPTFIHSDADIQLAARRCMWGKFLNLGQTCIAPDYVFVHSAVRAAFLNACKQILKEFYGSDVQKSPDYGRIVNERHVDRLNRVLTAEAGNVLVGGRVDREAKYIEPTLISASENSPSMSDEIFGPILPIIEYTDINQAIAFVNSRAKPLALYAFTNSSAVQKQIISSTSSGGVTINDCLMHFGNPNLPFGGVGSSGMGSYHGKFGFDTFSHKKAVLIKSIYGDAPARYPPYSSGKLKLLSYLGGIYRIDSGSFARFFKFIVIPAAVAIGLWKAGLKIRFEQ